MKTKKLSIICAFTAALTAMLLTPVNALALSPYTPFPIAWQQSEEAGAENQRLSYIPEMENWCDYPWNRGTETDNTVGLAGCSLFSVINNIYYNTAKIPNPNAMADYALEKGYRTVGVSGVKVEFFSAFAEDFGAEYGMSCVGSSRSAEEVLAHIRNGGSSSSNIYGHWITIVDYDEENDLYLILDSCQNCQRCENITWTDRENGVAWLTASELLDDGKRNYYGINKRYSVLFEFNYTFGAERGDADGDGSISINDSTSVLTNYALAAASMEQMPYHPHPNMNEVCQIAADVDGDGYISINDASSILEIYAKRAVGIE